MSRPTNGRFRRVFVFLKPLFWVTLVIMPTAVFTGAQLENHDAFCASCHTNPESEYVARAQAETAVDLASYHTSQTVRCIDCHSGKGVNGRLQAMTLGGHDLLQFITKQHTQPAPLTQPISDSHCTKCHSDISAESDFRYHYHTFLPEWQQQSADAATCVDCHSSHTLGSIEQLAFMHEPQTSTICQQCHSFARSHD